MTDTILSIIAVIVFLAVSFVCYKLGYAQGRRDEFNEFKDKSE